jgi:DNA topoisomerase-1
MSLLIVESPAKGRKIQKFLQGTGITVTSSFGHINNLDTEKLDAMIDTNFTPIYKLSKDKAKVIKELKSLGKGKDIILAADDDREGDAIAWHCGNLFKTDFTKNNRITFNEISKKAIDKALKNKHTLNMNSVNSQRCRQLLDLMIGFKLSPLLWKHVQTQEKGLSAGRVQSTLLRMLKEHEDKITNYEPEYSYDFTGKLRDVDDKERILDCIFHISDEYYELIDALDCNEILTLFKNNRVFHVTERKETQEKKSPPQPFITSTLQQTAQNDFGFPIAMTMQIAQKLYENGKITYMRTDSTFIAEDFKALIKNKVNQDYGPEYYRSHKPKKVKGAQEAHECIRPTDLNTVLSDGYEEKDKKLYNLILKRTITSHMKHAVYDVCKIDLMNDSTRHIGFYQGTTKSLVFEGFLKYTGATVEEKVSFDSIKSCELLESEIKETESNPPQYYNESTIVKKLESSGVGRPSTYASIVSTLYTRKYTVTTNIEGKKKEEPYYKLHESDKITKGVHKHGGIKQKKRIKLTDLGETVLSYLLTHFNDMICIQFTAQVETDLDKVTDGTLNWSAVLKKIYDVFHPIVIDQMGSKSVGKDVVHIGSYEIRTGRYGPYLNDSGKNYGLTTYLTMAKKKVEELVEEDIQILIQYPKTVGQYKRKDITLHIGQHSIYMKYDNKNYRLDKVTDHSFESLSSLISL